MHYLVRSFEAAQKRQQREAKKRQRELERRAKEMTNLSAQEQARLEVETHENALEVLLSVHKEQADPTDWLSLAASLPPVPPLRQSHNELKAHQRMVLAGGATRATTSLEQARRQDEQEYQTALKTYESDRTEWEKTTNMARRILDGDMDVYITALRELSPFSELSSIGSSLLFTVHSPRIIEVVLNTNGRQAVPAELKTLTASGKVSVKAMPKSRFVEIYQDYICGCVLRVARELFALLPIETLLITATADVLDNSTGQTSERPFLSVALPRTTLQSLNFEMLDPSDAVLAMAHRGDLKATRKTGDFESVTPLTVDDLPRQDVSADAPIPALLNAARQLRTSLFEQCAALTPPSANALSGIGEAS